jgi:hypothetical protein
METEKTFHYRVYSLMGIRIINYSSIQLLSSGISCLANIGY